MNIKFINSRVITNASVRTGNVNGNKNGREHYGVLLLVSEVRVFNL
jgi:hypothetical protein